MAIDELQFDTVNQRNLQVLHAYADRHFAAKAADDDYSGWLDRVESAGELTADELIRVHGELIALGMLKFELTNRHTGLRYQISERGHLALQMQKSASPDLINDVDEFDSAETLPLMAGDNVAAELGDLGAEAA